METLGLFDNVPMPEIRIPETLSYPHMPAARDTDTSREAAEAIAPSAATLRAKVLELLKVEPLTADECAKKLSVDKLAIRPRLSELYNLGLAMDSGERRKNTSGKRAIVWKAA